MKIDPAQFESMRPFRDDEIPAVMDRICSDPNFVYVAKFAYPEKTVEEAAKVIRSFRNVFEMQVEVMRRVTERIIRETTDGLSDGGFEHLDPSKRYLFISNHRDIMLDACLLQYLLWQHGHETSEITFGANLMGMPIVDDIGRANKMFRVERGGSMRDFYKSSLLLSNYMRYAICEKRQSVWIAQRNGRTKDGIDKTDPGLVRMLLMSGPDNAVESLAELNIVPMSVSYEWEPCDVLKATELYKSIGAKYVKKPGEDLNSILTGVLQPKGRVHIQLGAPLGATALQAAGVSDKHSAVQAVSSLLDAAIVSNYRLWPNNYIARDLQRGAELRPCEHYSEAEIAAFRAHLSKFDKLPEKAKEILLGIYAQ